MSGVKIEFSRREIEALAGLIDAGVRSVGIKSVKDAASIIEKIESALLADKDGDVS